MSASQSHPLLEIKGLKVAYTLDGRLGLAVDGMDLSVVRGGRVGIMGVSGSGKTQTMHAVLGLTDAHPGIVAGEIRLNGVDLLKGLNEACTVEMNDGRIVSVSKDLGGWRRTHSKQVESVLGSTVSMVFQEPVTTLVPYQTVEQQFRESARGFSAAGVGRLDPKELLERLGIKDPDGYMRKYPHELSGGEAQRVMLALALLGEPDLIILDEPASSVDAEIKESMLELINDVVSSKGLATICLSHDPDVISSLSHETYIMSQGRCVGHFKGAPDKTTLSPEGRRLFDAAEMKRSRIR